MLLPLDLSPGQWEPLIPALSAHYCTIILGGALLGSVASLEERGRFWAISAHSHAARHVGDRVG